LNLDRDGLTAVKAVFVHTASTSNVGGIRIIMRRIKKVIPGESKLSTRREKFSTAPEIR
jgi:hypothetical protein